MDLNESQHGEIFPSCLFNMSFLIIRWNPDTLVSRLASLGITMVIWTVSSWSKFVSLWKIVARGP